MSRRRSGKMMTKLAYTPYDGSSTPFTIGLQQLDPDRWIEPDDELAERLAERNRLLAEHGERVFRAEPGTEAAQQEVLDLLAAYLPDRHAHIYHRHGDLMRMAGHEVDLADPAIPPLQRAALLVQDDLVLMRKGENGWRLAAAFLAFPSSWRLADKFGLSLDDVHSPVPGFDGGSRNAGLISRMFDNLSPDRFVVRWNWSVNWRHAFFHPTPSLPEDVERAAPGDGVIRIERQTLRKLPASGDILFTIRIYLHPLAAILAQPNGADLALAMADQLEAMTPQEAEYKGLLTKRAELVSWLRTATSGSR